MRTKTLDADLKIMLRRLGPVLLSYLQPPSCLDFPKDAPINNCFGERPKSVTGVYLENSFWHELFKASRAALPAHLLQIMAASDTEPEAPEVAPLEYPPLGFAMPRPPSAQGARHAYQNWVEVISRNYLGMTSNFADKMDMQAPSPQAVLYSVASYICHCPTRGER
jgi:hypothetical protein